MNKLKYIIGVFVIIFVLLVWLNIPSPDFEAHHSYVGRERWYQNLNPLQRWLWDNKCGYEESCCNFGTSYGSNHIYLISGLACLLCITFAILEVDYLIVSIIVILFLVLTYL